MHTYRIGGLMRIFKLFIPLFLLCLLSPSSWGAAKTVQFQPLSEVINTSVGSIQSGTTLVPLITWGADIRTIYANGNSTSTAPDSIFSSAGLQINLKREDIFAKQVENFISGKSPYLRGTLGMINMASEVLARDSRTVPIVIYQLSESAGGDALVVKEGIQNAKDLRGKTVAVQAYGPHVDYLTTILAGAGLSPSDITIRWYPDLTGTDNTPMAAIYESGVDAAMVIIPDALALTSGGNVGTGAEDSVKGARIMLSTKTADRVIADVYAVRSDYYKSNKQNVQQFVHGLMQAQEAVKKITQNSNSKEYRTLMRASATLLLDSADAIADTEGLYADANHIDFGGNKKFFSDENYRRNFTNRNNEIQKAFVNMGLLSKSVTLQNADWDYSQFMRGISATGTVESPRFDESQVASVVARRQQQGTLREGELFAFEVFFKPNQNSFSYDLYQDAFDKVIDLAATYGGAIITVEGHSDPLGYLRKKKDGNSEVVLRQIKQSAKNLSVTRAGVVRDSIISYAQSKHVSLDKSQFAIVGHGISQPRNGICGNEPCAPKTEKEWRDNMRVEFRIIQVEAESEVFREL